MAHIKSIKNGVIRVASLLLILAIWAAIVAVPGMVNPGQIAQSVFTAQKTTLSTFHSEANTNSAARKVALSATSVDARKG